MTLLPAPLRGKSVSPAMLMLAMLLTTGVVLFASHIGWCQLAADQEAPPFALQDVDGRRHELAEAREADLVIIYFCNLDSGSNRKGLSRVNALMESRRGLNIKAFGVTPSSVESAKGFTKEIPLSFPLLIDNSRVVELYHSHLILPTVYILRRGLTVSKVVLGGGRSMEIQIENALDLAKSTGARKPETFEELKSKGMDSPGKSDDNPEAARTTSLPPYPIRKSTEQPEDKARKLFHFAREENPSLTWDDCLASKAVQRAQSLFEKGAFEHKDPASGKNPAFEMVKSCSQKAAYAGENLSRTMGSGSRAIHREFMESSTHRQNIQNRKYTRMGVGCRETICVELFVGF